MADTATLTESCFLRGAEDIGGFQPVWLLWPLACLVFLAAFKYKASICGKQASVHVVLLLVCLFVACTTFLVPLASRPPESSERLAQLTCGEVHSLPRVVDLTLSKGWADVYGTFWRGKKLVVKVQKTAPKPRTLPGARAAKSLENNTDSCSDEQHLRNEGEVSGLFAGNPHVVQRVLYCPEIPAIVYDYYPGTLLEILFDPTICEGPQWSLDLVLRICIGLARSVETLHRAIGGPVVHGEINPGQFMVDSNGGIRIGDFHHSSHSVVGLVNDCNVMAGGRYLSTEQALGEKPTTASDVYSLGMMIWTVFTKTYAFDDLHKEEVWGEIIAGIRPEIPKTMPSSLSNIVVSCWDSDPSRRPTAEGVRQDLENLQGVLYSDRLNTRSILDFGEVR